MPTDREPGIQRLIAAGSTASLGATTYPTTATEALPTRPVGNNSATVTVRASATLATTASTQSAAMTNYGALGMILSIDQSLVAATTAAGAGLGVMTHTLQIRDPLSGNYSNTTGTVVCTTGVATWQAMYYPGSAVLVPTTANVGTYPLGIPTQWRISSVGSSSETTWTYSVGAVYLPTAASSS